MKTNLRLTNAISIVPAVKQLIVVCLTLLYFCSCSTEEVKICFAGDLLLDRGVRQTIDRKGIDFLFDDVSKTFHIYDAVIVNLECPATTRTTPINKRFIFRGKPEWLPALHQSGITHVAMANNHTNDQGRGGIKDTYVHLQNNNLTPIGCGNHETEACAPTIIQKGKIKVAVFNSVFIPLENWMYLPDSFGICQISAKDLCESIKTFKASNSDCFVVIVLHWGVEYAEKPNISQRYQAQQLIDAGADAIIGHHPHVIQPIETYKGKYICYSLGNFIFDSQQPKAQQGILVGLTFTKDTIYCNEHPFHIKDCRPEID